MLLNTLGTKEVQGKKGHGEGVSAVAIGGLGWAAVSCPQALALGATGGTAHLLSAPTTAIIKALYSVFLPWLQILAGRQFSPSWKAVVCPDLSLYSSHCPESLVLIFLALIHSAHVDLYLIRLSDSNWIAARSWLFEIIETIKLIKIGGWKWRWCGKWIFIVRLWAKNFTPLWLRFSSGESKSIFSLRDPCMGHITGR